MKITPLLCPSCGAVLAVERDDPLARCEHCELSVVIEWPTSPRGPAVFRVPDPSGPIAVCPHCDGQVLRDLSAAGTSVACSRCGETARMPDATAVECRAILCSRHDRMFMSHQGCPECARERRLVD